MARNDITGDSIANTKGDAEKYAQGWDAIFKPKKDADKVWHRVNGSSIAFKGVTEDKLISISEDGGIVFPTSSDGVDMRITPSGGLEFKGLSKAESQSIQNSWMGYGRRVAESKPPVGYSTIAYRHVDAEGNAGAIQSKTYEVPTVVKALDFHDSQPVQYVWDDFLGWMLPDD